MGEARPGVSEAVESWRAKDPYGLLSSSSHITLKYLQGLGIRFSLEND